MNEIIQHYAQLQQNYLQQINQNAERNDDDDDNQQNVRRPKICAEDIISRNADNEMKMLTNFTVSEFEELFNEVDEIIRERVHADSLLTPKTKFLLALVWCKHNEVWRMQAKNFGINYSYARQTVYQIFARTHSVLEKKYIKWISVVERATTYQMPIPDWPTLLGSIDATVQRISRPSNRQSAFYSGKHKFHCLKIQAIVSPTGQLMHFTDCVEGSKHDFALFKESGLKELIEVENAKCNQLFGQNATVLCDSGYQGISNLLPGSVTPFKKPRGGELNDDQKDFNKRISKRRIIVENWFGRCKQLWAIIGGRYRQDRRTYNNVFGFCAAITNFHILKNPLRAREPGVIVNEEEG